MSVDLNRPWQVIRVYADDGTIAVTSTHRTERRAILRSLLDDAAEVLASTLTGRRRRWHSEARPNPQRPDPAPVHPKWRSHP